MVKKVEKTRSRKGSETPTSTENKNRSSHTVPIVIAVIAVSLAVGGWTVSQRLSQSNVSAGVKGAECCSPLFVSPKNGQKVAIVSTIWKSETVLWQFLCYHFSIGVDHIFLVIDSGDADDPQVHIARQFGEDRVTIWLHDSDMDKEYRKLNMYAKFGPFRKTEVMARQLLNMELALRHCVRKKIDWLISIDSDELFFTKEVRGVFTFFFRAGGGGGGMDWEK